LNFFLTVLQNPAHGILFILSPRKGYINIHSAPIFKPHVPHLTDKIFGRDKEAQDIIDTLLNHSRPRVAVLGPGGMGKTSLALVVMADSRIITRYPHRYFVSCEAAPTTDAILSEMADVMHVPVENRASHLQLHILDRLRDEKALVCFDNFETPWEPGSSRHRISEFLSSFDGIEDSALLLTMRGSQRPDGVKWSKPHLRELNQLPLFHSKEIFQEIADQAADDDAEKLLQNVEGIPLAAKLIASIIRDGSETTTRLLSRWSQEKTSLIETGGEHRLTSLDISIALSSDSPRMKKCPEAQDILILFALLPDGFPQQDHSPIQTALRNALYSINLQKAIQTLHAVSLIYVDRGQPHNIRYRILPPIRHYCSRLAFKQPLCAALTDVYIQFINQNYNYGDPSSHSTVLPELANAGEMISRALDNITISENVLFAASNYSGWCWYRNNYSDALIKKAIQRGSSYNDITLLGNCYRRQGMMYEGIDELEKAQGSFEAALELHRKAQDVLGEANNLTLLGDVQIRRDELESAEQSFSAALELHRKVQDVVGEANDLQKLGDVQMRRNELGKAEQSFSAALELHRKVHDDLGEANDLQKLGDVQMRRNELEKAEQSFLSALELHRKAQDVLGEATDLGKLGDVQMWRDEHEKAEQSFSAALELHRKAQDVVGEANDLGKLGDVQMWRDELEKAEQSFSAALELHRKAQSVLGEAYDLASLGDVQMRRDELEKAEQSFSAALELHRKAQSVLGEANNLRTLGDVQMRRDEVEKAEQSFSAALELHRKAHDVLGEANDLRKLGDVQMRRDELEKAGQSFSAALELHRKVQSVIGEANDLAKLGDVQIRQDEVEKAEQSFSAALELHRKAQSVIGEANDLAKLGDVQMWRDELEKAEELYVAALELYRKVRSVLGEAYAINKLRDVEMRRNELARTTHTTSSLNPSSPIPSFHSPL
jgi:tetratricopeptide (TPR) repeat protein